MLESERLLTRPLTPEELADCRRRWDAVGPAAVASALSSGAHNPLIDGHMLNTRAHAREWLRDHLCHAKARERRATWSARLTLAMAVIGAIAAIVAAVPVVQGWFGTS